MAVVMFISKYANVSLGDGANSPPNTALQSCQNIDFYISFEIKTAVMMPNLKMDCSDFIGV